LDVVSPKETNKSDAARNVATVNTASPANSVGEGGVNPDGISQNPNANDKPDGLSNPDKADMPQLILSKNSACKGDKIEIKTNVSDKGTWYANNKEIAVNTASINYTLTDDKDVDIMFKSDKRTILKTINVVNSSLAIVNEKQKDGLYNLKLNNKQTIGNWYINNRLVRTNENGISHNFKSVGKHTVKVVTVNAKCADVLEDVVEIKPMGNIFIPNVLTPDGDGKNDTYKVEIENYVKFSLQIYDLNSNLVFATNDPNIGWNGKYNNTDNQCTSGNYAGLLRYQLQGEEAKTKNIKITLITN
jgi:gliding motility-associated-like protein